MKRVQSIFKATRGASTVEYALLLLLLALATVSSVQNLCNDTGKSYHVAGQAIGGGTSGTGGPTPAGVDPPFCDLLE